MRSVEKAATAALFCGLALWSAQCQQPSQTTAPHRNNRHERTLNSEDRKAVLATALNWKKSRRHGRDCSHLVHDIYAKAGFPYPYADSEDLYSGVEGFRRVSRPQPGDVIVWHGHAGIVIHPSRHTFFSFLSGGPGIDDYRSRYWRLRGQPRFYRYVKDDPCTGCTLARRTGNGE